MCLWKKCRKGTGMMNCPVPGNLAYRPVCNEQNHSFIHLSSMCFIYCIPYGTYITFDQ